VVLVGIPFPALYDTKAGGAPHCYAGHQHVVKASQQVTAPKAML
jgi:hypothetical protein